MGLLRSSEAHSSHWMDNEGASCWQPAQLGDDSTPTGLIPTRVHEGFIGGSFVTVDTFTAKRYSPHKEFHLGPGAFTEECCVC